MAFKRDMTALHTRGKKGSVIKHVGKGATEQKLPNRHAMQTLTQGSPSDRNMQNYAKQTPDMQDTPDTLDGQSTGTNDFMPPAIG